MTPAYRAMRPPTGAAAVAASWLAVYAEQMQPRGGLKLKLQGNRQDERQVRFARLGIVRASDGEEIALVTDSTGRLRYRLPAGEYRLRLGAGIESEFSVAGGRWTLLRMRLS
jgi:hypothetical protein